MVSNFILQIGLVGFEPSRGTMQFQFLARTMSIQSQETHFHFALGVDGKEIAHRAAARRPLIAGRGGGRLIRSPLLII